MKNVGPREGGSITAAQFIQRFVEDGVRWAHVDMAGKAWSDKAGRDLRQGRDRLRRPAARPVCRGRPGSADGRRAMHVDFYQLGGSPLEQVIASLAEKLLADDGRLLVVAADEALACAARPDAVGPGPTSFLPHGIAGGADDARQPILLSTSPDAPNLARNMLIADGEWRDAALSYDRAFYLFDADTLDGARLAWKLLAGREGVERRYWAQESGQMGAARPEPCRRAPPPLGAALEFQPMPKHRRSPGHGRDAHLFDHQARCHPPQPDRRGHQDAGGGRPARRRLQAHPHDPRPGRGLLRRPHASGRSSTICVAFMTSGPVVVQVLEGENAVQRNRDVMGATNPEQADEGTIRKTYAESIEANSVHGSDSDENAQIEIDYFFKPEEIVG